MDNRYRSRKTHKQQMFQATTPEPISQSDFSANHYIEQTLSRKTTPSDTSLPSQARSSHSHMFRSSTPEPVSQLMCLMQSVIDANYGIAIKCLKEDLAVMFDHAHVQHHDGTQEFISPLKYALRIYDNALCNIFWSYVETDSELKKIFLIQVSQQVERVSFEPLLEAYEAYTNLYSNYSKTELAVSAEDILKAWIKIGKEQYFLPTHLLKRFCQENLAWHPQATFDSINHLKPEVCCIYDEKSQQIIKFTARNTGTGFGKRAALMRWPAIKDVGNKAGKIYLTEQPPMLQAFSVVMKDLETWRCFFDIQIQNQLSMLNQFEQPAKPKSSCIIL
jgi:hypothetical protein